MADILVQGSGYGLNSTKSGSLIGVHLKLTDSAVRALDEYQAVKAFNDQCPSIKFDGNTGLALFSDEEWFLVSENDILKIPGRTEGDLRIFQFNLSALQGDQKGSFDCVQQKSACSGSNLDLISTLRHKVVINATEDVYQVTKEKMTIAEEASKKNCAKEIKASGPHVVGRKIKKTVKKLTPSTSQLSSMARLHSGQAAVKPSTRPQTLALSTAQHGNRMPSVNGKVPNRTANISSALNGDGSRSKNAVSGKLYREWVIHLLALKPYKKPELILRLQKDAVRSKDKDSLATVLQEVARLNPRDNTFTLLKHIYKEVHSDWSHYTEADRQLVKRRVAQMSDSPSHSPSSSQNSPPRKRKESTVMSEPPKKARISHYQSRHREEPDSSLSENSVAKLSTPSKSAASSTSDTPDYLLQYTAITNDDQRRRYKEDFNSEYDEYRVCHANVEKISKRFLELEDILKKHQAGSADYEMIKNKVYQEYRTIKSDSKYVTEKKRCDYLHHKLSHIKKLVVEYDQMHSNL